MNVTIYIEESCMRLNILVKFCNKNLQILQFVIEHHFFEFSNIDKTEKTHAVRSIFMILDILHLWHNTFQIVASQFYQPMTDIVTF